MSVTKNHLKFEYVAIRIMLMTFKVLGLAPYSVGSSRRIDQNCQGSRTIKFSLSRRGCFYNLCLIVFQFRMLFISVPLIVENYYPEKSKEQILVTLTPSALCNGTMFLIWVIFGLRQKTVTRLLNRLLSVGSTLAVTCGNHQPETNQCFFFLMFFTNIIMWLILVLIDFISYDIVFSSFFNVFIATFILSWFVTQYAFVVKLIEIQFRGLNLQLSKRSVLFSLNPSQQTFFTSRLSQNDLSLPKVMMVRREHESLYNVASEISAFYSLPILLTIMYFSCAVVLTIFQVVEFFLFELGNYSNGILLSMVLKIVVIIGPTTLLACGVTNVDREASKSTDIIRGLLTFSETSQSERIQLQLFMIELLHRKIRFTACGLVSLDCTLLYSMISVVSTYLIILIQLNLDSSEDVR